MLRQIILVILFTLPFLIVFGGVMLLVEARLPWWALIITLINAPLLFLSDRAMSKFSTGNFTSGNVATLGTNNDVND